VTAIELGVAKPVLRTIAEPSAAKARPASGYHAVFSGPYTVALVRCVEDERCSASFPPAFPAFLRVTAHTGEELEARVEVNRGGPGNPGPTRSWRGSSTTTP
jgi:hypothetical protein